ncbi:MAG: hypothetical protein ACK40K_04565, partial [Raineya sp.]
DIILRWLSMGVYQGLMKDIDGHDTQDIVIFGVIQVIITGGTIFWVLSRFEGLKNKFQFLKEGFYEEKVSLSSVVFRIFNVISVTYILAGAIQEYKGYKDYISLHPETAPALYVIIFLVYAGIMVFLSFSSIAVQEEEKSDFVASSQLSEPFVGKWVKKLMKKPISETKIEEPFLDKNLFLNTFDYQIDHNDLEIIKVEGRLRNEHSRVEAYILESVMFGALAFSGFLSIIASERFNHTLSERWELTKEDTKKVYTINDITRLEKNNAVILDQNHILIDAKESEKTKNIIIMQGKQLDEKGKPKQTIISGKEKEDLNIIPQVKNTEIRIFWNEAMELLKNILLFRFDDISRSWARVTQPGNLIMLITMETLFCALFFLSVIASRLRYTKMTEEIDNLARLARNFNDKEEEVHNLVLQGLGDENVQSNLRRRLQSLGIKINQYLERANELLDKAKPILVYMSVFRNLGVIMFILILITSSLFFSKTLAFIFLMFSIVAYVYEYVDIKLRMKAK